ncbi:MAG: hypothetical protein GEU83_12080 [Pseudonocardiaceae bacterium]|nr:hypothetical protein [Pseudonocardiaceae bacterium]
MRPTLPDTLYHYTCTDRAPGIRADRELVPNYQPWIGWPLVWLTDMDTPDKAALGLTARHLLRCDRTAVRCTVARHPAVQPWWLWVRNADVDLLSRDLYEAAEGAAPAHWWVSMVPLPVAEVYDLTAEQVGA